MKESVRILLVEDDQSLLDGISDLLQVAELGYDVRVDTASDGQAGLELIAAAVPDLIVSDIMMPLMDGYAFLEAVRKNPAWVHIPFIFLTARGEKRDVWAGRLSGAELYITKPFDNDEFLQLARGQLDRTLQRQRARQHWHDNLKRGVLQLLNHEFRTPLTYVTAYYEMLADELSMEHGENLQEYLRGIQAGCIRLSRLVEDLIQVLELRTGEAQANYERLARPIENPGALLRDAGRQARPLAESKGITIAESFPADLPAVYGVATNLREVFSRLIDNAIKFTACKRDRAGKIQLSAGAADGQVYFSVADNGVGFPEQAHSQLFELFFQHNREQLEQQGSGSGLTIAKGIVDLHHGRIDLESDNDAGSKFTVVLPVYAPDSDPPHSSSSASARQATVLVVEDDRFLLDGLRELLEIYSGAYRLRVLTAANGRLGLDVLARQVPDLIISDIMMPEMDGYDFLEELRRNPAWLHIPFIFLTARGEREDIRRGWRHGVEEYITKPYDSDQLLELVITQLNRHFQVQSALHQNFEALKRGILDLLQPDFRLPLDLVSTYSHKMVLGLDQIQNDDDLKESLRGIQMGSSRLNLLVRDFISLAELKTGEAAAAYRLQAEPFDVAALLYETGVMLQDLHGPQRLQVTFDIPTTLPEATVSVRALSEAFDRLLTVLAEQSQDDSPVELSLQAAADEQRVHLVITSNRHGFEAATAACIRALFEEDDESILEAVECGPAMVILHGALKLHQAQIAFENDPAAGCSFTIGLPIWQPPGEQQ